MSINRVNISGNLTRDPELRNAQSGTAILSLGVAVNDRRRNPSTGEWEEYANFIDCVVFGNRCDFLNKTLRKGKKVHIEGKLRYSSWEKDGQKRSKIEVVVDDIDFELPPKQQAPQGYAPQQPPQAYQQQYAPPQQQAYQQQGYQQPAPQAYPPQQPHAYQPRQQPQAYGQPVSAPQAPQAATYQQPQQYAPQQPAAPPQQAPQQMQMQQPQPTVDVYDEDIPF